MCTIIYLILLHLYIISIGFVPLSSTARENETNVNPKLMVEWTPYNLHGRIVNGTKAALRQFPYQVRVARSCKIECFLLRYANCNYTVRGISGLSSWK